MYMFAKYVTPGGDNVYGNNDYYADAFRKPRWLTDPCMFISEILYTKSYEIKDYDHCKIIVK